MEVTDRLREEHRAILAALDHFEARLRHARRTGRLERATITPFLDFFQEFVDGCHHAKEEEVLFPALERRGMSACFGPLLVMRYEHDQGRDHVKTMRSLQGHAEDGNEAARDALLRRGEAFVELLRGHIEKEDHCLFPLVEDRLRAEDGFEILEAYGQVEGRSREVLHSLEALGVGVVAPVVSRSRASVGITGAEARCPRDRA
jgi:hemerythrin-like domain-containing protein